jgi:tRNA nucleotidyltransferase (CCA-adding enzyme)
MNRFALLTRGRPNQDFTCLDLELPAECALLVRVVSDWGGRVFLVGGLVRDWLLARSGLVPNRDSNWAGGGRDAKSDWDIAVDLRKTGKTLVQLMREICRQTGGRYVFYQRFLTGTITLPAGRIDISHTRAESYPGPAVLPKVQAAGIEEDLGRRDFTVNALAIEMNAQGQSRVVDLYGGQKDLQARLIRIIHPGSFIDDPTRIFRCIRFAVRLGFEIESGTAYLLRTAVKDGYPALLTPERVLYELRCICNETEVLKVLEAVVKESVLKGCWQWQPSQDFFTELKVLTQAGIRGELLFIYLLSRLPIAPNYPVTREEQRAQQALRDFPLLAGRLRRARRRSTFYRLLKPLPLPALKILTVLTEGLIKNRLELFLRELKDIKPELSSQDLIESGIKPGPQLGRILEQLLYARLDRRVKNRDSELRLVRRLRRKDV